MEKTHLQVIDLFPVIKHFYNQKYKANSKLKIFTGKHEDTQIRELKSGTIVIYNPALKKKRKSQYKKGMDLVYKPFDEKSFNFNKLREEEIFFYLDFNKRDIIL